ncbi:MAG: DNA primase [Vicinamibacterales bacterium]
MGRFPQGLIDDLKLQADIVQVVQDFVALKQAGANYKGLCPFHAEKTPSFIVNREKGFFHCFGCGAGGDVFKFLELHEKVGFLEAVQLVASRFGVKLPETETDERDAHDTAEREALLKVHEVAAGHFSRQLEGPGGAPARRLLAERALTPETWARLGLGYAPPLRSSLASTLRSAGFDLPLLLRSGLVLQREDGEVVDRFRSRLIFPIHRDSGSVVAFAGRAMEGSQQPKYLNSPETPIYTKGRTLYGLNLTRQAIRRLGYAVLVEGYFDFAQALQAGVSTAVAACGTALTPQQVHLLKRFTSKVVLSFDPDPAGQGAAARSSGMLVGEGFQVNVVLLPGGDDPDSFIRKQGGAAFVDAIRRSRPYLDYLLDRSAASHDLGTDAGRRAFLEEMLKAAAQIPDPAARDQFGDKLAHRARITEEVVRSEVRKAAVQRRVTVTSHDVPGLGALKPAEKGLVWGLVHDPRATVEALAALDPEDLEELSSGTVFEAALQLQDLAPEAVPPALLARLSTNEARMVAAVAADPAPPAPAAECVSALKRMRFERERAAVQREIDRLQETGASGQDEQLEALWHRKLDLLRQIHVLSEGGSEKRPRV